MTKRDKALQVIRAAGAKGDQALFMRTYVENRISYPVAQKAYEEGAALARFVRNRDSAK